MYALHVHFSGSLISCYFLVIVCAPDNGSIAWIAVGLLFGLGTAGIYSSINSDAYFIF